MTQAVKFAAPRCAGVRCPSCGGRRGCTPASPVARTLPTSRRVAGRRFVEPGGRPGPGRDGFRCTGRGSGLRALVPEPPTDPGGREPVRRSRFLPGPPEIDGQRPREPELCIGGDHQPRPPVGPRMTRSERSPPRISTGRSVSRWAMRGASYPASARPGLLGRPASTGRRRRAGRDQLTELGRGPRGNVRAGLQTIRVQHRRPRHPAR
jgi:hypothetical protein